MHILLAKFFPYVYLADNGAEGYAAYRCHRPDIIVTDINMSVMDGLEMAQKIKKDEPEAKIIIVSALDEKKYFQKAINIGIFRYLSKPVRVPVLIEALCDAASAIEHEKNIKIMEGRFKDIFNYQNNLLAMVQDGTPILVNRQFLDFFGVSNLENFMEEHMGLDPLLLEHNGFLFSVGENRWYDEVLKTPGKLFHTKMVNHNGEIRHLILNLRTVPEKENCAILSFNDITDLNLLTIFDSNAVLSDKKNQDRYAVMKLMNVVKDNNAEVKLHDFYRGLTIVNGAVLVKIDENEIVLKTTYSQLKAIKLSKQGTISSEIFPYSVICRAVKAIDFDKQTVTFSQMEFTPESADKRTYIRLEPDPAQNSVTFFYRDIKYFGQTRIVDLSIRSVKIEIDALPAGLAVNELVKIAIVLFSDKQPSNILTTATVYRIDHNPQNYHIVLLFDLPDQNLQKLTAYLSMRQMELIREFKDL